MAWNKGTEKLVEALRKAGKAETVEAVQQEDGSVTLGVELDEHAFTLSAGHLRLVRGNLSTLDQPRESLRKRFNRIKNPQQYSLEELRARNLPLYWNEQWLRRELNRLGSYAAVAREHGYPSATTITSYAKRRYGISKQDEFDRKRAQIIEEYEPGEITQHDLANKYGVAVATVYRWLAEARNDRDADPDQEP